MIWKNICIVWSSRVNGVAHLSVSLARKKKIVSMRYHILSSTCLNLTIAIFFMIPLAIIRFLHNDYKVAILLLHFLIL